MNYPINSGEFKEWLKTKTGNFTYTQPTNCAFAQFLKFRYPDVADTVCVGSTRYRIGGERNDLPTDLYIRMNRFMDMQHTSMDYERSFEKLATFF